MYAASTEQESGCRFRTAGKLAGEWMGRRLSGRWCCATVCSSGSCPRCSAARPPARPRSPGPSPRLTTAPVKSRRATCGGRPHRPRGRWYGPGTVDRRRNGLFPGWWRGCPGSAEVPHGQRDTALRADPSVGGRDAGHGPWRRLMAPRDSGESHRGVTPLELLVDLCFVVASKRKPTSPPWTRPCSAEPTSRPALARSRWGSTRRSGWRPRQPQAQDTRWL